jgi:hypothetical protein
MFDQDMRDGKIPDFRGTIGGHVYLCRCQITVQDAVPVRVIQSLGNLNHEGHLCFRRHGRFLRNQALKTGPAERLHYDEMMPSLFP